VELIGATVSLVPLELSQLPDLLKYSGDANLWTWWVRRPPVDETTLRAEIESALASQATGDRIPLAMRLNETGDHIGSTSLWHIDKVDRSLEIGSTWLASRFHGTGVNRECKDLLINHAFDELGMERVLLQTDELNSRSRRAIEKLGAKFDRIERENMVTWNGRIRSSAMYVLTREDWRAARMSRTGPDFLTFEHQG